MKERELPPEEVDLAVCEIPERILIKIFWLGEGMDGDYQGPGDTPVLRLDVWDLRQDSPDDSATYSYATAMPAWLPREVIQSVCEAMAFDVEKEDSWRRRVEQWTWTNEMEAWKIHKNKEGRGKRWGWWKE